MKKISIMLLAALMLFAFVACDDKTPEVPAATAEEAKLAGDFIDSLDQAKIKTDLGKVIGNTADETLEAALTFADDDETKAATFTFKNYKTGTKAVADVFTSVPTIESGNVVVTLKGEDGNAVEFTAEALGTAKTYDITVNSVKFVSGTSNVTMSFKASGTIADGVISVPAASAVTDLKVLFNGTEKSVTWADIYKNTDQGSANK